MTTARTAVTDGSASALSGGKFANSALTGTFAQFYNMEGVAVGAAVAAGTTIEAAEGNSIAGRLAGGVKLVYDFVFAPAEVDSISNIQYGLRGGMCTCGSILWRIWRIAR